MGRFYGKHIPDEFDPNYSKQEYPKDLEHIAWYHLGYEDGFNASEYDRIQKADEKLRRENQALRGDLETLSKTKQDLAEEYEFIKKITDQYSVKK